MIRDGKKETAQFTGPIVRARLNTKETSPCVYFAQYKNKRVVVKGPLLQPEMGRIAVPRCKEVLSPGIAVAKTITVLDLYADRSDYCPVGVRTKCSSRRLYGFQVIEDIFDDETLPTIPYASEAWPCPTPILNMRKTKNVSFVHHSSLLDTQVGIDLCKHILLDYIMGSQDGLDLSNFMIKNGRVYQICNESWMVRGWNLRDKGIASPGLEKFLCEYWASIFLPWLKSVLHKVPELMLKMSFMNQIKASAIKLLNMRSPSELFENPRPKIVKKRFYLASDDITETPPAKKQTQAVSMQTAGIGSAQTVLPVEKPVHLPHKKHVTEVFMVGSPEWFDIGLVKLRTALIQGSFYDAVAAFTSLWEVPKTKIQGLAVRVRLVEYLGLCAMEIFNDKSTVAVMQIMELVGKDGSVAELVSAIMCITQHVKESGKISFPHAPIGGPMYQEMFMKYNLTSAHFSLWKRAISGSWLALSNLMVKHLKGVARRSSLHNFFVSLRCQRDRAVLGQFMLAFDRTGLHGMGATVSNPMALSACTSVVFNI